MSGTASTWNKLDEQKVKTLECISVGYLVDETKEAIALAQNVGSNGSIGDIMTIIKSCIKRKREL